ncbi:hypothetical protein [Zobellia sp. B3R18]|uniref:hypothetical protein n=1 Tax=Zobellia sp. B3R18 TaxID=2841568 RepID=UPI001C07A2B8|nr:hypothetical protein [Zobellia sp. B3R18]MBU2975550.1 hypothetical protein [Zobellia sp. B3R18]
MKLIDYFKLNKETFKFCLKLCGIIFTLIAATISIAVAIKTGTKENPIYVFLIAVLFGNSLGLLIAFLGFVAGYLKAKSIFDFHDGIPKDLVKDLGIKVRPVKNDFRYNFMDFELVGVNRNSPLILRLSPSKKEVWITVPIVFSHIESDTVKINQFNSKYKIRDIQINGLGIFTSTNLNKWKRLSEVKIMEKIAELYKIAEDENITIFKYYERITSYNRVDGSSIK